MKIKHPCVGCGRPIASPLGSTVPVRTLLYDGRFGGEKLYVDERLPDYSAAASDGFQCPHCDAWNFYDYED